MPFVKFLGISFWVAWFGIAYGSAVWVQPTSGTSDPVMVMFNVSTAAHMVSLIAMAVASNKLPRFFRESWGMVSSGFVAVIGSALIIFAAPPYLDSGTVFFVGCALTGVGTAGLSLNAGLLLCSVRPADAIAYLMFAEIMAALFQFAVQGLPAPVALIVFSLLPLVSALCFVVGASSPLPEAVTESSRLRPDARFVSLLAVVFVLSVVANVSKGGHTSVIPPGQLYVDGSVTNLITVLVIAALALFALTSRKALNFSHWFYPMVVVIIVSLLATYLFPESGSLGFVISGVAYQLFDMIVWYTLSYIVYQSKVSAVFVVAAGRAVVACGVTLGNLLGGYCVAVEQSSPLVTSVIYLVLLVAAIATFIVLPERQVDRLLMPIPDEDEAAGCDGRNLRDRIPEAAYAGDARGLVEEPVDGGAPRRGACPAETSEVRNRAFPSPSPIRSAEEAEACAGAPAADSVAAKAASADWHKLVLRLARERSLTERECEVFALLARGRGSQSISDALTISLYTTRAHTRNIYTKLDVHSRQELIDMVDRYVEEGGEG